MGFDGGAHRTVVGLYEDAGGFGIESFVKGCRTDEIGEDDRDDLARAGCFDRSAAIDFSRLRLAGRCAWRRRRATLTAEFLAGLVRRAALRTCQRQRGAALRTELTSGAVRVVACSATHPRSDRKSTRLN